MIQIIDKSSSGKTTRLLLLAKEKNATIVCENPYAMKEKAIRCNLFGLNFISYQDFEDYYNNEIIKNNYVIDDLDYFLKYHFGNKFIGFTLTKEN